MRSPLLEHLKDLQDFPEMLLRQLFEKLFDRTTARLILVKLHRPWHFLNDISVKIRFQEQACGFFIRKGREGRNFTKRKLRYPSS